MSATVMDILEFLAEVYAEARCYSRMATCRLSLRQLFEPRNDNIMSTPLIDRFMKAVFNITPPVKCTVQTWDVDVVLDHLENMPHHSKLHMFLLGSKLALLILLATGCRMTEIGGINLDDLIITPTSFNFRIVQLAKTYSITNLDGDLMSFTVKSNPHNEKLCPLVHLKAYIDRTQQCRTSRFLFISSLAPYGHLTQQRLTKWIRGLIISAGITKTGGMLQSPRSAVSSELAARGVPIDQIMAHCKWNNACSFYRNYHLKGPNVPCSVFLQRQLKIRQAYVQGVKPNKAAEPLEQLTQRPPNVNKGNRVKSSTVTPEIRETLRQTLKFTKVGVTADDSEIISEKQHMKVTQEQALQSQHQESSSENIASSSQQSTPADSSATITPVVSQEPLDITLEHPVSEVDKLDLP